MLFLSDDKTFFDLFDRSAANMVRTAELFRQMLQEYARRTELSGAIRDAEREGDAITHQTMTRLDKTFITPLDREDIHALVSQTDDVVDYLEAAAKRMLLYGIETPNADILKQAETCVQITTVLARAINGVRNFKNQEPLGKLLIEIHEWENKGDELNHAALARLFETNDPMYVLKWKELYDLVECSIDACETVANTIRSIMVKNA